MKKQITITFANEDDAKQFERYAGMSKAQEGTVTGLYCGLMCSALKRSQLSVVTSAPDWKLDKVAESIGEICHAAGLELESYSRKLLDKLTQEERRKFSWNGEFPMRLAKSLLCASADVINDQFACESTLKEIKAIKRICKNRY